MTLVFIGVRVAERTKVRVSHARGHRFESCRGNYFKKDLFFLIIGDKNSLSLTEALASLMIALQRGMIEKTSYFLHSMLRKPVLKTSENQLENFRTY